MKRPALFLVPAAVIVVLLTFAGLAFSAVNDTARKAGWPELFNMTNGQPIHRFTLTPDATTAESNLTASGGTAVTYTLVGGERICLEALTTDAYIEFVAAASYASSNAKAFFLPKDQGLKQDYCFTLKRGTTSISALCSASGPCLVKGFEKL